MWLSKETLSFRPAKVPADTRHSYDCFGETIKNPGEVVENKTFAGNHGGE